MYHNSLNICFPWPLKLALSFKSKNGGMPFVQYFYNIYQQIWAGRDKNISHKISMNYFTLCSHRTPILHQQQKISFESFSRALWVHLAKNYTIPSSKAPKPHVEIITCMNLDNIFYILISIVFSTRSKIGVLQTKSQYLVISFHLSEG